MKAETMNEEFDDPRLAALRVETIYGDWDRAPFGPESPEMIVVAAA